MGGLNVEPHPENHVADERRDCRHSHVACAAPGPAMGLGELGGPSDLPFRPEPLVLKTPLIPRRCNLVRITRSAF